VPKLIGWIVRNGNIFYDWQRNMISGNEMKGDTLSCVSKIKFKEILYHYRL